MNKIFSTLAFCLPFFLQAQVANELQRIAMPFSPGETNYPSVGGFNCPIFSPADLNNDGQQDLFVFDRIGNVNRTFQFQSNNWVYRPEFLDNFPKLNDWALLRDFDGDGAADIFTYNDGNIGGIRVFKGKYVNGRLAFDRINFAFNGNILSFPTGSGPLNLYVNTVDIPAIDDIDGDGDLDILAFEVGGGHVFWYKNQSIERNFRKDSLIFELEDRCWGKFLDNGFQPSVKLGTQTTCATGIIGGGISIEPRHPGASLATFDANNDGAKEAVLGSVSYPNMTFLQNSGTVGTAWMSRQDNNFPSNTEGVNLPVFPAAFFADLDNDGRRDVVVSTVSTNFVENNKVAWFYKNTGTNAAPTFQLQKKNFIVGDLVDFGSNANPALADINRDGLLDLVVGNGSFFVGGTDRDARLFYYQNVGTSAAPSFRLIDSNYLNFKQFSSLDVTDFSPTFGDMDNDGDADLIVCENSGTLIYCQNLGNGQFAAPILSWKNIQVGGGKPTIADLDRDGLPDLIIGSQQGRLRYFRNIGTRTNPNFSDTPTNATLGNVQVAELFDPSGYAAPQFLDLAGKWTLFVGSNNGRLWVFDQIDGNLTGTFRTVNSNYGQLKDGWRVTPAIGNIKSDDGKLEMILGNQRGGLTTYRLGYNVNGTTDVQNIDNQQLATIFPNPSNGKVTVELPKNTTTELRIYSTLGQLLYFQKNTPPQYFADLETFGKGIFVFELRFENGQRQVLKVVNR